MKNNINRKKANAKLGVGLSVGGIAFIIGLIIVTMGFDYIGAGHIGVKERMGVINDVAWGPGVQWTGILTSSQSFTTRVQLYEYDVNAFSSDAQVVQTKVALNFRIDPQRAPEIYKNIGVNYQDVIIAPIVQETVKANTAKYPLDDLVKKRGDVKAAITTALIQKLEDKGLIVTEVALTNFEFSPEVQVAIESKQVAAQDALAAENRLREMEFTSQSMALQSEVIEIKKLDLEFAKIEVQRIMAEKWSGNYPNTLVMSGGEEQSLLLNLGGLASS